MDRREDLIRVQRDENPEFEAFFQECCENYKKNPDMVFPSRRPFYPKRNYRKPHYYAPKKFYNGNGQSHSNGHHHHSNGSAPHYAAEETSHRRGLKTDSQSFTLGDFLVVKSESDKTNKKINLARKERKMEIMILMMIFLSKGRKCLETQKIKSKPMM